jgi:hypothetical protein
MMRIRPCLKLLGGQAWQACPPTYSGLGILTFISGSATGAVCSDF